jgi:hypothetical protein
MKVSLIDLRDGTDLEQRIPKEDDGSTGLILVAHGSSSSLTGLSVDNLPIFGSTKLIWLYACNCGQTLIHEIAQKGVKVFGYITAVLAPVSFQSLEDSVPGYIRTALSEYGGEIATSPVLRHVQESLFHKATSMFEQAKNEHDGILLMKALLINHSRLTLRCS